MRALSSGGFDQINAGLGFEIETDKVRYFLFDLDGFPFGQKGKGEIENRIGIRVVHWNLEVR